MALLTITKATQKSLKQVQLLNYWNDIQNAKTE